MQEELDAIGQECSKKVRAGADLLGLSHGLYLMEVCHPKVSVSHLPSPLHIHIHNFLTRGRVFLTEHRRVRKGLVVKLEGCPRRKRTPKENNKCVSREENAPEPQGPPSKQGVGLFFEVLI